MHALGKGLRKPVGKCLDQDGGIVVIGSFETLGDGDLLEARSHNEAADKVFQSAVDGRDEVGQGDIRAPVTLRQLLPQGEEGGDFLAARVVGEQPDIIAHRIGGPEADHPARPEPFLFDDLGQHRLGIVP